jgi:hypothetical protein
MKAKILIFFFAFSINHLLLTTNCFAGAGTTGAQFLKISPSARSSSMAGASSAFADDAFVLYSNPAGLVNLNNAQFNATYLRYFADVDYGYMAYASKPSENGAFGFAYTYLIVPDIEKRDASETRLDNFNARDMSLAISYARSDAAPQLIEDLAVGGSLKLINSQIDQVVAYTFALDLSAMYRVGEKLNTFIALNNISYGIKFREITDNLPLDLKMGLSFKASSSLGLGFEIDRYLLDNKFYAATGLEYWPIDKLALRGGYRFGYDTSSLGQNVGLGLGVGFRIWTMGLDYAFVPFGDLGDTHRITFSAGF